MNLVISTVQPSFALSGGAFEFVSQPFKNKNNSEKRKEEEARKCLAGYGVPLHMKKEVDKALFKYAFAENTAGANDETRLCLKSVKGISWGACEDYEKCVKALADVWNQRVREGGKHLSVSVNLPEEDAMIGEKGMQYFEDLWKEENRGNGMKVEVVRWKGTDHDTAGEAGNGAIEKMLELVKGVRSSGSAAAEDGA